MFSRSDLTVLIVDDHPMNRAVLSAFVQTASWVVHEAADGNEAVAAVQNQTFDLVFMDIRMPGMDGYEATRAIRAVGGQAGGMPIVAVSAEPEASAWPLARAAGMNGYVEKPVRPASLVSVVEAALSAGEGRG